MKTYQDHNKDHIILNQVTVCPLHCGTLKYSSVDHRDQADQGNHSTFNQENFLQPKNGDHQGHHKDDIILSQVTVCPLPCGILKNSSVDQRDQADQCNHSILNLEKFLQPKNEKVSGPPQRPYHS